MSFLSRLGLDMGLLDVSSITVAKFSDLKKMESKQKKKT